MSDTINPLQFFFRTDLGVAIFLGLLLDTIWPLTWIVGYLSDPATNIPVLDVTIIATIQFLAICIPAYLLLRKNMVIMVYLWIVIVLSLIVYVIFSTYDNPSYIVIQIN